MFANPPAVQGHRHPHADAVYPLAQGSLGVRANVPAGIPGRIVLQP